MNWLALACGALLATLGAAAAAQTTPAKKQLVERVLQLTQPGLDQTARTLIEQPAAQMLQAAGRALQQLPADKREAVAAQIKADVQKYVDEATPLLREHATKLAPSTLGVALEEQFSEDELKQLIAWLDSPLNRKYQQVGPKIQQQFLQKLVADARPTIDPKLKALRAQLAQRLGVAPLPAVAASAPASAPPARR